MICVEDGGLLFDGGLVIQKQLRFSELDPHVIKKTDDYGYKSVLLHQQLMDGARFLVRLYFYPDETLMMAQLFLLTDPQSCSADFSLQTQFFARTARCTALCVSMGKR